MKGPKTPSERPRLTPWASSRMVAFGLDGDRFPVALKNDRGDRLDLHPRCLALMALVTGEDDNLAGRPCCLKSLLSLDAGEACLIGLLLKMVSLHLQRVQARQKGLVMLDLLDEILGEMWFVHDRCLFAISLLREAIISQEPWGCWSSHQRGSLVDT